MITDMWNILQDKLVTNSNNGLHSGKTAPYQDLISFAESFTVKTPKKELEKWQQEWIARGKLVVSCDKVTAEKGLTPSQRINFINAVTRGLL